MKVDRAACAWRDATAAFILSACMVFAAAPAEIMAADGFVAPATGGARHYAQPRLTPVPQMQLPPAQTTSAAAGTAVPLIPPVRSTSYLPQTTTPATVSAQTNPVADTTAGSQPLLAPLSVPPSHGAITESTGIAPGGTPVVAPNAGIQGFETSPGIDNTITQSIDAGQVPMPSAGAMGIPFGNQTGIPPQPASTFNPFAAPQTNHLPVAPLSTHLAAPAAQPMLSGPTGATLSNPAAAAPVLSPPPSFGSSLVWHSYTASMLKAGSDRTLFQQQLVIPLYQSSNSLIFADIRGTWDDLSSSEGNFGFVNRQLVTPHRIQGSYFFYDRKRTRYDNAFDQLTFGYEQMTRTHESRLNVYVPLDGTKSAPGATRVLTPTGGGVFMQAGRERAYYGIDTEFGWIMADYGSTVVRGFLGGFHFDTNGFRNITGPRFRIESRSHDLWTAGARFTWGFEYQWDEVRDDQFNFLARLVIPLGPIQVAPSGSSWFHRRMLDRVIRDDDIVTLAGASGPLEGVFDVETGVPLEPDTTSYVTAESGPNALAKAVEDGKSIIVVDGSEGEFDEEFPIRVEPYQHILGGGFAVRGLKTGEQIILGERPTIQGVDPDVNVFSVGENAGWTIRGLDINGGFDAIAGSDVTGVTISDNKITGFSNDGIRLGNLDNSNITDNIISGFRDGGTGISAHDVFATTIRNNEINNTRNGITLGIIDSTSEVVRNSVSMALEDGFRFEDNEGLFGQNTAYRSGGSGFVFQDNYGVITQNSARSNELDGYEFRDNFYDFKDNFATDNRLSGYYFNDNDGTFSQNIARNNGDDGFTFNDNLFDFEWNSATGNNEFGFRVTGGSEFSEPFGRGNHASGNGASDDIPAPGID